MQRPSVLLPGAAQAPVAGTFDMKRAVDLLFKFIEFVLAALLVAMVVMVLGNVILRYGFDTGISAGEELSRTAFVWLTFVGAVVAARDGTHLGVDSLLRRLSGKSRLALAAASEVLVLACCALMLRGTWVQHEVNATTRSLITGMPLIWMFGILYVTGAGIGLISLYKLWRIVSGQATDRDIFGAAADHSDEHPEGAAL